MAQSQHPCVDPTPMIRIPTSDCQRERNIVILRAHRRIVAQIVEQNDEKTHVKRNVEKTMSNMWVFCVSNT